MAKYSYEFKKKVVMAYLNGEGGEVYLASKFNIALPRNIKVWIKSYLAFGEYDKNNLFDIESYMKRRGKAKLNKDTVIVRL